MTQGCQPPVKHLYDKNPSRFWKELSCRRGMISRDLKDLISDMLEYRPEDRPDVAAVRQYSWLTKHDAVDEDTLKAIMRERNN